jgi:TPR repeat
MPSRSCPRPSPPTARPSISIRKLPEAIAAYHKAIDIDPKNAPAYTDLGLALAAQKKLPEAIAAYHKAIDIDPKHAFPYTNLGNALYYQQKLPEAISFSFFFVIVRILFLQIVVTPSDIAASSSPTSGPTRRRASATRCRSRSRPTR